MSRELNCALLLAAGSGARMQGCVEDKILAPVRGVPVFNYSVKAFAESKLIENICVVYRDDAQREELAAALNPSVQPRVVWAPGGAERQHSVLNGLKALPPKTTHTLIHDGARPLISAELIRKLIETTREDGAACPAHPVTDTVKRIPEAGQLRRIPLEDLERSRLWAMETPQCFKHGDILKAYRQVVDEGLTITDDCAAAACLGIKTTLIHNLSPNPKITTANDLDYLEWLMDGRSRSAVKPIAP